MRRRERKKERVWERRREEKKKSICMFVSVRVCALVAFRQKSED